MAEIGTHELAVVMGAFTVGALMKKLLAREALSDQERHMVSAFADSLTRDAEALFPSGPIPGDVLEVDRVDA